MDCARAISIHLPNTMQRLILTILGLDSFLPFRLDGVVAILASVVAFLSENSHHAVDDSPGDG